MTDVVISNAVRNLIIIQISQSLRSFEMTGIVIPNERRVISNERGTSVVSFRTNDAGVRRNLSLFTFLTIIQRFLSRTSFEMTGIVIPTERRRSIIVIPTEQRRCALSFRQSEERATACPDDVGNREGIFHYSLFAFLTIINRFLSRASFEMTGIVISNERALCHFERTTQE